MLFRVGAPLNEYRVKASTGAIESTNLIYQDEYARRCGYRGGLVPGPSIFAYMSRSLVDFAGREWLERGWAEVRFIHPVYEGEEVRVGGSVTSIDANGTVWMEFQATNPQGVECSAGRAALPPSPPPHMPAAADYPPTKSRGSRPITLDSLKAGQHLTPFSSDFTWRLQWEYCQKTIRDHHSIYHRVIHPGWLLSQADCILAANYDLRAWIHVSSAVQNYRAQEEECRVETRGRVHEKYEHKGHHFVVLDLALFAGQSCLQTIRHTAIFRIAPKAA